MPTLNNVLGSKNRQAVLTSFLPTAKKNNTLGETSNKTPKPSAKDKDRCSTLAGSKIAHGLTKTDTSTLKKSSNSKRTLQSLPKESDRGNTQPVSKIEHDSKKVATLMQGGSNSAKPKNAVTHKTQQVYFKEVLAYKETGTKSTRDKDKTSSSVCSNALVLRDSNNTKPGERLKSSMSNSPVMDFQSKPAATSQVKERFSENAQLAEGSKATSLSKVETFIIQHLTGISKKNEQRFDSIDVKLDLILEQLLNGVRSVSLEEANVHIPVDSYEEWIDSEKVLANRDTAIALLRYAHIQFMLKRTKNQVESHSKQWIWQSNKRHSRECQKAGDLNSNDSDMTRKRKQDEDDYEKKTNQVTMKMKQVYSTMNFGID
ncbi:hypothetical protein OUZ56_012538 [Daphnia magna]|uniref:Uncharacterized protein n=1 Tax=Daphnia magna TaxID=35525 RepID=A0ABQ9Z3B4_9CRUS|nr:hypothetical protein OUZ56_012538 [Daphnia magna]